MGTELTAQTLTVTITEALAVDHANGTTNDIDFAQTHTHTYGSIANISKRVIKLSNTNETVVANFGATESAGTYKQADVRYIRVTNLDGSDTLQLGLNDGASDGAFLKLGPDSSFVWGSVTSGDLEVEGAHTISTFDDVTELAVKGSANQQLELVIASV